jgi:voltage-gated potassium channel Kch
VAVARDRATRARTQLRRGRWALVALLVVAAAVLGFIGLGNLRAPSSTGPTTLPLPFLDRLYDTVLLFKMTLILPPPFPWELELAQWLAPVAVVYTAFSAAAAIFAQQWAELRVRLFFRGHVIVCGLGNCGARLAPAFRAQGLRVVVVDKDLSEAADPAGLEGCRTQGIPVVTGDATDAHVLRRAGITRAGYLVAVCGNDETNADVALAARRALAPAAGAPSPGGRGRVLRCFIQVGDDRLCRLLEESVLADPSRAYVRLEFFNVVRSGLKALLDEYGAVLLEGTVPPHLVVVGPGRLARHLVAEAARRWWLVRAQDGERCRITLVSAEAKDSVLLLHERYPALRTACDLVACEADPSEPESPPVAIALEAPVGRCLAVVCSDDDDAATVRATIVVRRSLPEGVPVVVCTRGRSALPGLLGGRGSGGLPNVQSFGLFDRACSPDILLNGVPEELAQSVHADYVRRRQEEIAQMAHALYVENRQSGGSLPADDPSLLPWEKLPEILKESNRDQAADIGRKLAMIGCHLEPSPSWDASPRPFSPEEIELLGRAEHDRWCEERKRNGWQLGPVRDPVAKTHPDLVPWDNLTERVKDLDREAVRAIPLFLARLGYAIVSSAPDDAAAGVGGNGRDVPAPRALTPKGT